MPIEIVVAVVAAAPARRAGMPGALVARHELHTARRRGARRSAPTPRARGSAGSTGCASQSSRLVNSRSTSSPPYSPGGRLIECSTTSVDPRAGGARAEVRRRAAAARRATSRRARRARGVRRSSRSPIGAVAADVRCPGAPCGSASAAATGPGCAPAAVRLKRWRSSARTRISRSTLVEVARQVGRQRRGGRRARRLRRQHGAGAARSVTGEACAALSASTARAGRGRSMRSPRRRTAPPRGAAGSRARARCRGTDSARRCCSASRRQRGGGDTPASRAMRVEQRRRRCAGRSSTPLAQRRHADLDHVEAVVQVLPEAAGLHLGAEVLVRGADDAHVDRRPRCVAPTGRTERSWIARSSLVCIASGRSPISSRNSVPPLRRLEEAVAVLGGAGEGALAVAEELGLEQLLGDRAAVDRDEGPSLRVAARVDRARDQFLAGARLAVHQHRRHAARHLLDQRAHLLHRRRTRRPAAASAAAAPAARTARGGRSRAARRRCSDGRPTAPSSAPCGAAAERRRDDRAELLQVDRLGQVVVGAGLQRLDRVLGRAVGGDDDAPSRAGRLLRCAAAGRARVPSGSRMSVMTAL